MAAAKDVWALDFDGVVADSVGESSLSAWMVLSCSPCPVLLDVLDAEHSRPMYSHMLVCLPEPKEEAKTLSS